MIKTFTAKIAGMRKPQEFVTYPRKSPDQEVQVQSDRAIGRFDPKTGKGILNWRGSNHKYGIHLSPMLGAEPFDFPADFVAAAIGAGAVTSDGTIVIHLGSAS